MQHMTRTLPIHSTKSLGLTNLKSFFRNGCGGNGHLVSELITHGGFIISLSATGECLLNFRQNARSCYTRFYKVNDREGNMFKTIAGFMGRLWGSCCGNEPLRETVQGTYNGPSQETAQESYREPTKEVTPKKIFIEGAGECDGSLKITKLITRVLNACFANDKQKQGIADRLEAELPERYGVESNERIAISIIRLIVKHQDEAYSDTAFGMARSDWRDLLMNAGHGYEADCHLKWAQSILKEQPRIELKN